MGSKRTRPFSGRRSSSAPAHPLPRSFHRYALNFPSGTDADMRATIIGATMLIDLGFSEDN